MRFVSHEVRTPMNSVGLGAKLLLDELEDVLGIDRKEGEPRDSRSTISMLKGDKNVPSEKVFDWLTLIKAIQTNTDAAVDVLNELLQWDKIEAGKLILELSEVNIDELVRSTTAEFAVVAQEKNVEVSTALDNKAPVDLEHGQCGRIVVGDRMRLVQVCFSLDV